ncbi:MAG: bifunctional oligoribonuclease/PAP phosphatase NrnA [Ignavibacteriae bacterium]|nr:bifunctional oligoribonuclease/PAP phosphatase NrnA [Ignavibacteriota bacterium]MCB9259241.1 bifunctional oligoribonuclease/PAP phosphatase NrnA [Ignavibacteriales bacterium]
MLSYSELFSILNSNSSFLITTHVNPDADAIGSEIALAGILDQLQKEYIIINHSETPYNIQFLDPDNIIQKFDPSIHASLFNKVEVAIFLDLNFLNRTVKMEKYFREFKGKKICIDHHTNPEGFTEFNIIDQTKSATGEILFDFISEVEELKLNNKIALPIYAAIMTDTGSFRFSKTTPELHNKIAELLKYDLYPEEIYDKIYSQYEFSRSLLLGKTLSTLSLSASKEICYMKVTKEMLEETNAVESDVDGFVNFALNIKDVKVGILFFELHDGLKISFRSKENIPINKLAEKFGGGGHLNAAGSRLFNLSLNEVIPKVIKEAEIILTNYKG